MFKTTARLSNAEKDGMRDAYVVGVAEGYRAGRIAALREVGCEYCGGTDKHEVRGGAVCGCDVPLRQRCRRCRLLAEVESGKDTAEVGDDR